jgi:hypothetical protein
VGVTWPDHVDAILAGDLTAALGYLTPAGGVVVTAIAPIGLRDRDTGTVTFTTSLGLGRKLERIKRNPRIALAYHAREHGFASGEQYVLVQGTCRPVGAADRDYLERVVRPAGTRFLGPPREGFFWDRWLRVYYADRVPVTVDVERVVVWPALDASGEAVVHGAPLPDADPRPQSPPKNGTGPRIDAAKAERRLTKLPYVLAGWRGADGFPTVAPVDVAPGLRLTSAMGLPPGGRRAGVLGHAYKPQLTGLNVRQYTGWLEDGVYAPHTQFGFVTPQNKTIVLLANGFMARRGLRKASARV